MTWQKVRDLFKQAVPLTSEHDGRVLTLKEFCCVEITLAVAEELDITLERSCRFYEILAPYFRKVLLCMQTFFCLIIATCISKWICR